MAAMVMMRKHVHIAVAAHAACICVCVEWPSGTVVHTRVICAAAAGPGPYTNTVVTRMIKVKF